MNVAVPGHVRTVEREQLKQLLAAGAQLVDVLPESGIGVAARCLQQLHRRECQRDRPVVVLVRVVVDPVDTRPGLTQADVQQLVSKLRIRRQSKQPVSQLHVQRHRQAPDQDWPRAVGPLVGLGVATAVALLLAGALRTSDTRRHEEAEVG